MPDGDAAAAEAVPDDGDAAADAAEHAAEAEPV